MKLYISGPMRRHKNYNFPAFLEAHGELECRDHEVVNPALLDLQEGLFEAFDEEYCKLSDTTCDEFYVGGRDWSAYTFIPCGEFVYVEAIRRDVRELSGCDGIVMLPGWTDSEGALEEKYVAEKILRLPVYDYAPDHPSGITLQKGARWQELTTSTKAK